MSNPSDSLTEHAATAPHASPVNTPFARQLYWSVRRELWEHGAIYVAPLSIAAVAFVGFLYGSIHLPGAVRANMVDAAQGMKAISMPFDAMAFAVVATGLVVAVFYSLSALNTERRDRSILFWKSLPVSDLTTVLSKVAAPMVILPLVCFAIIVPLQTIMWIWDTLIVLANGLSPQALWAHTPLLRIWSTLAIGLPLLALWFSPLYAWLILVSAWARRAPFLWAVAPPLLLALVERMALGTTTIWSWLGLRMVGPFVAAYQEGRHLPPGQASLTNPADLASPQLWFGLVLAVGFIAAAIRLRRSRDPI